MKDLAAIVALYSILDDWLQSTRAEYLSADDHANAHRIADRQRFNDQAYFVLCWGQFEITVDDTCRRAIKNRQDKPAWPDRRGWDRYQPDDKRLSGLPFDERVALVTDCRAGTGSPWARIMHLYTLRNQIAHGRLTPDRIDVAAIAGEFYSLQAKLLD